MNRLTHEGLALIKAFEGFSSTPYPDPVGFPTIGFGHLILPGESFTEITPKEGEEILLEDLAIAERLVRAHVVFPINDNQYSALISLVFNLGPGPLHGTLGGKLNAGDVENAAAEFDRWTFAGGLKLPGLIRRRAAERALFEQPA